MKYEVFLHWNTKLFLQKILGLLLSTFWILVKPYELCKSCGRSPLESLERKSFEHWRTMYLWICYLARVISHRYIKYTLVHCLKLFPTFSMSVSFRRSFKTFICSRILKVAIATSKFMNEVYNGRFASEFKFSMLKETIEDYVYET